MQQYWSYNGYGITYYEGSGTTIVDNLGFELRRFPKLGYDKGKIEAEKYIDHLTQEIFYETMVHDFSTKGSFGN